MGSPPPAAPVQLQPHRELMGKASPSNSFKPQSKPGLYDIIVFHTAKAIFSSCLFPVGTAQGLALSAHCSNSSTHSITSLSLLLPLPSPTLGLVSTNLISLPSEQWHSEGFWKGSSGRQKDGLPTTLGYWGWREIISFSSLAKTRETNL